MKQLSSLSLHNEQAGLNWVVLHIRHIFHQEPAGVATFLGVKQNEDWTLFCPNEAYDPETGTGLIPGKKHWSFNKWLSRKQVLIQGPSTKPSLQTQKKQPFSPRNGFPPMFLRMDLWGEDFEILYKRLETEGKGRKTVKAQHLWFLCHQKIWGTWYMEMIDWCICVSFWDGKDSG